MNQLDILREVRKLQAQKREMENNYKLGLYSDIWYNAEIEVINNTIEVKKALWNKIYSIHANI